MLCVFLYEGSGLGLLVTIVDSCPRGSGFESSDCILDGWHDVAPNTTYVTLKRLQRLMVGR